MYDYEIESDVLSVQELMETLRISKGIAYQLLNSGEIKAFRIGRVWKIPKAMLDDFIIESAKRKTVY